MPCAEVTKHGSDGDTRRPRFHRRMKAVLYKTGQESVRRISGSMKGIKRGLKDIQQRESPWAHRVFVILALVELITVGFGLFLTALQPEDRYEVFLWVLSMCGAIFLFYFACDAVAKENVVQIWVFSVGSLLLTARLWLVFSMRSASEASCLIVTSFVNLSCLGLTYFVVPDFGRHIYYRVGGREHLVGLYKKFQIFMALLKADVQFSVVLVIIAEYYFSLAVEFAVLAVALLLFTILLSLASVSWVQGELKKPTLMFAAACLLQPTFYLIALARLNTDEAARSTLEEEALWHENKVGGSLFNETGVSPEERALILVNSTAGVCIIIRFMMLFSLGLVYNGFDGGLSEALFKPKKKEDEDPKWGGWIPGGYPELPEVNATNATEAQPILAAPGTPRMEPATSFGMGEGYGVITGPILHASSMPANAQNNFSIGTPPRNISLGGPNAIPLGFVDPPAALTPKKRPAPQVVEEVREEVIEEEEEVHTLVPVNDIDTDVTNLFNPISAQSRATSEEELDVLLID